jgi:hypothetical protein
MLDVNSLFREEPGIVAAKQGIRPKDIFARRTLVLDGAVWRAMQNSIGRFLHMSRDDSDRDDSDSPQTNEACWARLFGVIPGRRAAANPESRRPVSGAWPSGFRVRLRFAAAPRNDTLQILTHLQPFTPKVPTQAGLGRLRRLLAALRARGACHNQTLIMRIDRGAGTTGIAGQRRTSKKLTRASRWTQEVKR